MGPDHLVRFGNSVRLSEETDDTQPDLYGLRVTHRRPVLRDWLFIEFGDAYDRALRRDRLTRTRADQAD
jgi:hypothetical protein